MAKVTAPAIEASGIPAATPPNKTPTANPSGMLCSVMANTKSVVRCQGDLTPSVSLKLIYIFSNLNIDKTKFICTVLKISRNKQELNYSYIYGIVENNDITNLYILELLVSSFA